MNVLRSAGLMVGAVVAVALAGCAASGPSAVPATPSRSAGVPSPVASPVDTAAEAREHVLAAYRGMWDDYVAASRTADYTAKQLERHASGDALALLVNGLRLNHRNGTVVIGAPSFAPKITRLTDARATISDCADGTNSRTVRKDTGEPANDFGGGSGRHKVDATLTKNGVTWRVTRLRIWETGSC